MFVFPLSLSLFQEFPQFLDGILQLVGVVTVVLHDPLVEVHFRLLGLVEFCQLGTAQAVLLGEDRGLLDLQEPAGGTERPGPSINGITFSKVVPQQQNTFNVISYNLWRRDPAKYKLAFSIDIFCSRVKAHFSITSVWSRIQRSQNDEHFYTPALMFRV